MPIDFNKWGNEPDTLDFDRIKGIALSNIEMVLHRWLPGGKAVRGEYLCASIRGGAGESCSTSISKGTGGDFAGDERWGDPIDMVATIEGISQGEAAKKLEAFLGITEGTPTPPPIQKQTEEEKRATAQQVSAVLWMEGEACPPTHPYLIKKQVNVDNGVRYHPATGNLLIPLRDGQDILGVQRITATGEKKVNPGGRLSGCYHVIQGELDTVYICEGYATAMTVHMATGKTAVMAVSAGNLQAVGEKLAKMYPAARLVFAADNDQGGEKNPGIEMAEKAVRHLKRGQVIAPPFPEGQKGDWNDYALIHGGAATKALLSAKSQLPLLVDIMDFAPKAPEYLIDRLIETPATGVLLGASGSGKSFVALDWALSVATGHKWCGREVKKGPVIYICGEGKHGVTRRVGAWYQAHGVKQERGQFFLTTKRVEIGKDSSAYLTAIINEKAEKHGKPAMIVVDTLARSVPAGCDENSVKDMQEWMNNIDSIRDEYECMVLVVHHTGHSKDAAQRGRGSSAIIGALDFEAALDKHKKIIINTKMKDGEEWAPIRYELHGVEVDNWSSAVVKYDFDYDPKKAARETAYRIAARAALREAIQAEGIGNMCLKETWIICMKERFDEDQKESSRKALTRRGGEIDKMIEGGEVKFDGKYYMPIASDKDITRSMFNEIL